MAISPISRFMVDSFLSRNPKLSLSRIMGFATSSSAQNFWTHLQTNDPNNLERTLRTVEGKLDIKCVNEIIQKCALHQPLLGLRFFIWAGLQPNYRHSSSMYSKACELFDISKNPEIVAQVVEAYRIEDSLVSVKTFKVVLNLCKQAKLANEGLWVLTKMKEFDCQPDTTAYNVVITLFCERGDMEKASDLLKEMSLINLYPDMMTYLAMIKGFSSAGRLEDACALFKDMKKQGCMPSAVAYSALLDGVCRFGNSATALELLQLMEKEGGTSTPNVVTYTSVIQSFCERSQTTEAMKILDRMEASGCLPNRVTVTTLIKKLCAEGEIEEAYKLVDRVVAGGSVYYDECYSSLVVSLLRINETEEAEKLFRRMLASDVMPDGLAFTTMIKELCQKGRALDGLYLYNEIEKLGAIPTLDSDICSIILAGLCKESHSVEATKFARMMVNRRIQLKAPCANIVVAHLKNSGKEELISYLSAMEK